MFLFYVVSFVNCLAAIIGLIKRKAFKNNGLKFFPIFISVQFLNQIASSLYFRVFHLGANSWMYNLFMVFDMLSFSYFFYHQFHNSNTKKATLSLTLVFIVFYLVNIFFVQGFVVYNSYSRSLMGINLVIFSMMYFYQLFNDLNMVENLTRKADFWIVIGIFFFYLTSTVILSATNYMVSLGDELPKYYNPDTMKFLVITLYSFYILGFLCHKPEKIS